MQRPDILVFFFFTHLGLFSNLYFCFQGLFIETGLMQGPGMLVSFYTSRSLFTYVVFFQGFFIVRGLMQGLDMLVVFHICMSLFTYENIFKVSLLRSDARTRYVGLFSRERETCVHVCSRERERERESACVCVCVCVCVCLCVWVGGWVGG